MTGPRFLRLLRGSALAGAPRRKRKTDDSGFTLVEAAIALTIFTFLLGVTVIIMFTLQQTTSRISTTYTNVNSQLSLATNLQRLVRAAVAPGPSYSSSTPVPAFTKTAPPTPTSMTFFANTGTANGPVKVTAKCVATTTPAKKTLCKTPTTTITVTIAKPVAGSCPFSTKSTTTAKCRWGTAQTLITIPNVRNGNNDQALFVYAWRTPTATTGTVHTVCAVNVKTTCSGTDSSVFGSCKKATNGGATFSNCKVGAIESVTYDIQINANTTNLYGGSQAEDDTGIFTLSSKSMQYNPTVG